MSEQDKLVDKIVDAVFRCVEFDEDGTPWLNSIKARTLIRRYLTDYEAALEKVLTWYDKDGSVGGCDTLIEEVVRPLFKKED